MEKQDDKRVEFLERKQAALESQLQGILEDQKVSVDRGSPRIAATMNPSLDQDRRDERPIGSAGGPGRNWRGPNQDRNSSANFSYGRSNYRGQDRDFRNQRQFVPYSDNEGRRGEGRNGQWTRDNDRQHRYIYIKRDPEVCLFHRRRLWNSERCEKERCKFFEKYGEGRFSHNINEPQDVGRQTDVARNGH